MIEGARILIVDDNLEIIDLLSSFLEPTQCTIFKATTARSAIELLKSTEIDIAVLDVQLPDADGISLLDMIKVKYPGTSVIMMTGYHDYNFVIDAMKKGASDFLLKPLEFDKLMLTLLRIAKERELLTEKQNILYTLEDKKKIEVLNRDLQAKIEELTTMYHISNKLNSLNVFEDIYEKIIEIISEILDVYHCGYYIVDPENGSLILFRERSKDGSHIDNSIIEMPKDFITSSNSMPVKHFTRENKLYLPVIIKGECVGFIMVGDQNGSGVMKRGSFADKDIHVMKLIVEKASMQIENRILYESLFENILLTLTSFITAINKRDLYTEGHCRRVADMSLKLGSEIGLSQNDRNVLKIVCPLHDLGKIGIPDSILLKPGSLTDEEFHTMKLHSDYGEEIIGRFNILFDEAKIIRFHHERYDGRGYPDSIAGSDIPLCSRTLMVCDAFDAMTTNRPYRKAMEVSEALAEIHRGKGKQFDPDIADHFIGMIESEQHG